MPSFKYLKKYDVTSETTAAFAFPDLPSRPVLRCAPATQENRAYLNEKQRQLVELAASAPAKQEDVDKMTEAEKEARRVARRIQSAAIIGRTCVRGFDVAPVDDEGAAVEFSTENAIAWLEAICVDCEWQYNRFVEWLIEPANFMPSRQPVALAKN